MNASILMVCRNGLHLTKAAVSSALGQDIPATVMVIDNASTDNTNPWLRTKPICTVSLTPQRSLAECWNRGIKTFFETMAEEVLVINNDVQLLPQTYHCLRSLKLPFVSGISVGEFSQMKMPEKWGNLSPHPDFSCFMIRREVFHKVGPFDESMYPAYVEDCDYHVRMHRAGITAYAADIPFYHPRSSTLRESDPREASIIRRGADVNRERFKKKYGCEPRSAEYEKLFSQLPLLGEPPVEI